MVQTSFEMVLIKTLGHVRFHHALLKYILQGTTRNMASPALAGLVIEFFYTGTLALATLFLEVFSEEVPKSVVCLAVTAVSTHSIPH